MTESEWQAGYAAFVAANPKSDMTYASWKLFERRRRSAEGEERRTEILHKEWEERKQKLSLLRARIYGIDDEHVRLCFSELLNLIYGEE